MGSGLCSANFRIIARTKHRKVKTVMSALVFGNMAEGPLDVFGIKASCKGSEVFPKNREYIKVIYYNVFVKLSIRLVLFIIRQNLDMTKSLNSRGGVSGLSERCSAQA